MRARLAIAILLLAACPAAAQLIPTPGGSGQSMAGVPEQAFSFYRCFCNTTSGAPLPSQLTFAPPPSTQWNGNVYATSANDAIFKAQSFCTAERHGGVFNCINCRCDR